MWDQGDMGLKEGWGVCKRHSSFEAMGTSMDISVFMVLTSASEVVLSPSL